MAWYNTYRPVQFDDVVGQDLVKQILVKTVEMDTPKHAYLFSGPRGVGKTTLARIFAHALNHVGENSQAALDIVELDAASNTGIDDIRMLRESAQVAPIAGKYKIFIIDEVHMLSKPAMNALLKILEEPPHYLIFLLATTNPEKVLPTVLSRLIKLPLAAHTVAGIVTRLKHIAQAENVQIDTDALEMIAKRAQGSQRDAINILETIASFGFDKLSPQIVGELLGLVPEVVFDKLAQALVEQSEEKIKNTIEELNRLNIDPYPFLDQALNYYLEKAVLEGKQMYDCIRAISQVLDLHYPITTNFQAVSLVVTYYQPSVTNSNKNTSSPQSTPNNLPPVHIAPQEKKETKKEVVVETPPTPLTEPPLKEAPKVADDGQFMREVEALQNAERPQPLKMIPDLIIEARDAHIVVLRTGIGMFIPTLKSETVKKWVHSCVPAATIEVEQAPSIVPTKPTRKKAEDSDKTRENQPVSDPTPSPDADKTEEVFYSVYNKLPEGSIQNLKVFDGKIPKPIPKNSEKEFEEHADELFEFE